ncbi:MAG: EAL domain-containing protein [Pseudonocardiales bacterium]|nr:EAL domain-containing protein [Pseudonocardiales bacterium]
MNPPVAPEFLVRFPAPWSAQKSVGVGFVVSDRHVLTCAHVVNAALGRDQRAREQPSADAVLLLRFPLRGDAIRQAQVIEWLPPPSRGIAGGDIAGLEIIGEPLPVDLMAARLVDWTSPGGAVDVFGYPVEKDRPAGGWVSCHVRGRVGNGLLQLDSDADAALRTQPGYSGSPVIERVSGAVIGMFSATSYDDRNRDAYVIPSTTLRATWEDVLGLVPPCPYRWLAPFDEQDRAVFFGRERDTERLLAAVQRSPLVVVIGPSGVGKSSLVRAGLIPALQDSETWAVTQCRPGQGRPFLPFRELAGALFRAEDLKASVRALRSRESELVAGGLAELLGAISSARNRRVLVVLEQMEEIFTAGSNSSVVASFLDSLLTLPDQLGGSGVATLVVTLRADFIEYLLQSPDAARRLDSRVVSLSPLGPAGLRRVIEEPALKLSVNFESGLVDRIIADASAEAGTLPLLQFALSELWAMQRRRLISHQSYTEIGCLEGGLRTHAENVIAELLLRGTSEFAVERALLSLIDRTGDGVLTTRRTCHPTQLPREQQAVIDALTAARLVTADHGHDGPRAELAHEVLIRAWPRLAELAEKEVTFVRARSELEHWQRQWEQGRYGLLSDAMLAEARRWCDERPEETRSIRKLVEHSEVEQRQRMRESRLRSRLEYLEYLAYRDPLTGLANRQMVTERLAQIFAGPAGQRRVGLCFLDLDGFKAVNDSLSRDIGDELLKIVASRLTRCCGPEQLVARMGGDEFMIIVEDTTGAADMVTLADRILATMAEPIQVGDHELNVTASIGVVEQPVADTDPKDLLQAADITMYRAKVDGKARYAMYDQNRNEREVTRFTLSATMLAAVERGEFFLEYQPLVGLGDRSLRGVEALVRWRHPTFGVIEPERFIDLAAESGSIVQLGRWVLIRACQQARIWQDAFGAAAPFVSVNLAPRQLHEPDLVADVTQVLLDNGLEPSGLHLELTEQALMGDEAAALTVLTELHGLGVRIALDDFGTGYWNLPHLRLLPITELKLARSFAVDLQSPSHLVDQRIVAALVDMAHALELTVTAEGIETPLQLARFGAVGCDAGQGSLFAPPSTAQQIDALLQAASPLDDPSGEAL